MAVNSYVLAQGGQYNSFFEATSKSVYSNALSSEMGILMRDIYLPLLPMEAPGINVYKAYKYLLEMELFPETEFHPYRYWTKDDVYAIVGYGAAVYIPMLFPDMEHVDLMNGKDPAVLIQEGELKAEISKYESSSVKVQNGDLSSLGAYGKLNFLPMVVPSSICRQFKSKIPAGTKFIIGAKGGRAHVNSLEILNIYESPGYSDDFTAEQINYEMFGGEIEELADIIIEHLLKIEDEEKKRKEENENFKKEMEEFLA